jgi:hypothetical protein
VIDLKCTDWLSNPRYRKYLRPATLFNEEKFSQYVGEIGSQQPITQNTEEFIDSLFGDESKQDENIFEGEVINAEFR